MKTLQFILILLVVCSCSSQEKPHPNEKPSFATAIENEGYNYIGVTETPAGIWDTLMFGYTDRKNGIYHEREERFKTLRISGYKFEEASDNIYKSRLMIYKFEFEDLMEEERFENFQNYIWNYQQHSKNQVKFYKEDENWFLRFEPMP